MPTIYNIDRADATQEDHLYVAPVANEKGSYAAVVLFKGTFGPFFVSRTSADDAKAQADAWTLANLSATTSYRGEM